MQLHHGVEDVGENRRFNGRFPIIEQSVSSTDPRVCGVLGMEITGRAPAITWTTTTQITCG